MNKRPNKRRCELCGRIRNDTSEHIGCLALSLLLILTMIANYKFITIVWEYLK